jgi:mono/diheme cytochrome c family protein
VLVALSQKRGELQSRAARLLARVEWPGKPGATLPIPPLSPLEQQRFEAGGEIYRNICQGCHLADGRGQENVAPGLVGSPLALARAEVTARILLHGKEGGIGLMPPVGSTLDDEKIADVLTYIRREWGQAGSPVDAAAVKAVRLGTLDRVRPWTYDELMALIVEQTDEKRD